MSAAFSRWYERHGAGMSEATARKVWNAAVDEAYDLTLEAALAQRQKSLTASSDVDGGFASAKFHEARAVGSLVFGLRA